MLKKAGMVTVGVAATLFAAAPLASATECHDDGGHNEHHQSSEDSGDCSFVGGTGGGARGGDANGALAGIGGEAAGGIGGNNIGNIANCSSFLNDNVNDNNVASNNSVAL